MFIAILNLIEFRVIQVPYKIDLATLDKNCHLFSAGFNITSGYSIESVSEKLSNSTFFNCFFGINEIFLTMIVLACFTWILSVCFEKAINMKSDNIKLKEENDLTI